VPIANYTWDFGDGNVTTVTTPVITHVYTAAGIYTVNLTVTCNYDPVLASLGLLSNSTQQEITVVPPVPPTEWKVLINGTLLSAQKIIVTQNATHIFIYLTYSKGFNTVAITNRLSSTILMALSSNSTDLGSSVTISGNITAEDHTGRPNVNVTIQSKTIGAATWNTIHTVETNSHSDYNYTWTPGAAGIYDVMTSWEGDNETLGNESAVQTLAVIESSTISIALSSANITFGSSVTISGNITAEDHTGRPTALVTINYRLISEALWTAAGQNQTDQNSRYTFVWTPTTLGTYEIEATWLGNETTHNATSSVLTLAAKWTSTISIALSSTEITKGKSVTISGNITAEDNNKLANATVAILYKPSSGEWISLANVTTNSNGTYTNTWKPKTEGTYYIMATWKGDNTTFGNETETLTLTVTKAPAVISTLEILAVIIVVIIVIAAIAVYFTKFRKPKGKQTVP
jgi:5-hydroxyisourate hydrolase-like protein (transthyretin family)